MGIFNFFCPLFQSTSSVWRTTHIDGNKQNNHAISIHVLRVEDDVRADTGQLHPRDFNPRPPCGGRRLRALMSRYAATFQSTSSVWRTTLLSMSSFPFNPNFNPRPPCGGRPLRPKTPRSPSNFNPRPPCGGRRVVAVHAPRNARFQSTSSVWRTTRLTAQDVELKEDFNPRPPCGGRRW